MWKDLPITYGYMRSLKLPRAFKFLGDCLRRAKLFPRTTDGSSSIKNTARFVVSNDDILRLPVSQQMLRRLTTTV